MGRFWLRVVGMGVLLCATAMFLGYELGSETARLLGGEPGIWARVAKGFVWGGVIAGLQWPIVRTVGVPPMQFLVASAVCFAAGYPVGQTVQGMLVHDWSLNWVWGYGGALVTFGLFLGTPQWWVFRRHIPRASLWLPLSVLGWILTGAAWINFGVNSGEDAIAYGIVTGLGLAWLVYSRPLPPLADSSPHTPGARVPSRDALIAFGLGIAIIASFVAFFGRHLPSFAVDTTVDPASYDDYVGRYDYANEGAMTVTTEDGRLFAQLTGQRRFEIFPCAKDQFFWKVVAAQITFVRDDQGRVSGGIHRQDGQTQDVPRLE